MDDIEEEININTGFDRGIDYETIKEKLINRINQLYEKYQEDPTNVGNKRIIFAVIATIQLRNGSRISEAVKAFNLFMKHGIHNKSFV